uniref:N-acetyl-D-glucosamine kinase n=1 Tax=Bursaphelenchus xylophilus TaxID=6326 RepID=A0A1I7SRL9_BURXY
MPKKGCRKWLRGLDIQQVGGRSAETCNQRLPRLRSRLLAPALSGSEPGARAGNFGVGSGSRAQSRSQAYQRSENSSWSIEYLLKQYKLEARLIRQVEREHSLQLGVIMAHSDHRFFAGVEGGATISRYYIFNEDGKTVQTNEADGLNCILVGVEGTGDRIANNMRILAKNAKINLPVRAMGMGLAGAESAEFNQKVVNYIKSEHNDIADTIYLTSDSVAAVAANFPLEKGGIVLICGTGSAARLLTPDHKVHCAGGWGHLISDGGSAYWIARRSWDLLKSGFESALRAQSDVKVVKLFEPVHSAAFGAAVLATKQGQIQWNHEIEDVETLNKTLLDVIELS